jgi:hypothetical protein
MAPSTIEYQGLGIPDLYTSQGISHIERILKYSHLDDEITGQLIRASVEQLKLELGCNGPTLSLPYEDFAKLATNCWIRQTWQFMDAHQIRNEDTSPDFLLSRANDSCRYRCSTSRESETTNSNDSIYVDSSSKCLRSPILQPAAVPRSPRLHGTGYEIRHELPGTNGLRKEHPVFRIGYCGEHPSLRFSVSSREIS